MMDVWNDTTVATLLQWWVYWINLLHTLNLDNVISQTYLNKNTKKLELKNTLTELKNLRASMAESLKRKKQSVTRRQVIWYYPATRERRERNNKGVKKAFLNYEKPPSKQNLHRGVAKEERKGKEAYLKKQRLETSQTFRKTWTSNYLR